MSNENVPITRRNVLETAGAAVATAAVPTVGAADRSRREEFRELVETSNRILAETGDVERAHGYLRARGVGVTSRSRTYQLPSASATLSTDDGSLEISPDSFSTSSLDITLSLYSGTTCAKQEYPYYASLSWFYDWDSSENGSPPNDAAGLYYDDANWWQIPDSVSSATKSSSYVSYANGSYSGVGLAFEVDDVAIYDDDPDGASHAGLYLDPTGSYGADQRLVRGEYVHNWSSVDPTIDSVSVGIPAGVSVSYDTELDVNEWEVTEEDDGTFLRVYQEDATPCY